MKMGEGGGTGPIPRKICVGFIKPEQLEGDAIYVQLIKSPLGSIQIAMNMSSHEPFYYRIENGSGEKVETNPDSSLCCYSRTYRFEDCSELGGISPDERKERENEWISKYKGALENLIKDNNGDLDDTRLMTEALEMQRRIREIRDSSDLQ